MKRREAERLRNEAAAYRDDWDAVVERDRKADGWLVRVTYDTIEMDTAKGVKTRREFLRFRTRERYDDFCRYWDS